MAMDTSSIIPSDDHDCCSERASTGCLIRQTKAPFPFIELEGKCSDPGTLLVLGDQVLEEGGEHQLWIFLEAAGMPGVYYIQPGGEVRNLVLTASGGGLKYSRPSLQLRKKIPDHTQLWLFCAPENGSIGRCIMNYNGMVLDSRDGKTSKGTHVILHPRHKGENQKWHLDVSKVMN